MPHENYDSLLSSRISQPIRTLVICSIIDYAKEVARDAHLHQHLTVSPINAGILDFPEFAKEFVKNHETQASVHSPLDPFIFEWANAVAEVEDVESECMQYGPFCSLLFCLFPPYSFVIYPQYGTNTLKRVDLAVLLKGNDQKNVLLLLENKRGILFQNDSSRFEADQQLRRRLTEEAANCGLPTLLGFSAFGKRIAVYQINTHTLEIAPKEVKSTETDFCENLAPTTFWKHTLPEANALAAL